MCVVRANVEKADRKDFWHIQVASKSFHWRKKKDKKKKKKKKLEPLNVNEHEEKKLSRIKESQGIAAFKWLYVILSNATMKLFEVMRSVASMYISELSPSQSAHKLTTVFWFSEIFLRFLVQTYAVNMIQYQF